MRLLLTQSPSDFLSEALLDALADDRDLLVRERALRRAELEPQRQRLATLSELLAPVEVEHAHGAELRLAGCLHALEHGPRLDGLVDDDRDVLQHGRVGDEDIAVVVDEAVEART